MQNMCFQVMWREMIDPFLNFNDATVEVYEWISNHITYVVMDVIPYAWWN